MDEWVCILVTVVGVILLVPFLIGLAVGTASARRRCRICGQKVDQDALKCMRCDTPLVTPSASPAGSQFKMVRRVIGHWYKSDRIDEQQRDQLFGFVDQDEQQEAERKPAPSAAAQEAADLVQPAAAQQQPAPPAVSPPAVTPVDLAGMQVSATTPEPPLIDGPAEVPAEIPPAPVPPRRALGEILYAFMDQRNIRWGELISGLLIIGSAIGLVISLRATPLGTLPYFASLIFMLITAVIFSGGMYSLKKWKLRTASRSVLVVTSLLVPLNFLAGSWEGTASVAPIASGNPVYLLALLVGLGGLGTISYFATRALMTTGWWRLWLAIMGPSVGQLIINRTAAPGMADLTVGLLFVLPLASFLAANMLQWQVTSRWKKITPRRAEPGFLVLAIGAFSLVLPGILLAIMAEDRIGTIRQLAGALVLVGSTVMVIGILVHQRAYQLFSFRLRVTGTATALIGGSLVVMALFLTWPEPGAMQRVSLLGGVSLLLLSIFGRFATTLMSSVLLLGAGLWLTLQIATGQYDQLDTTSLATRHGELVVDGLTSVFAMVYAMILLVLGRTTFSRLGPEYRRMANWSGLAAHLFSVGLALLVTLIAIGDPLLGQLRHADYTGLVFTLYAVALIATGFRIPWRWVNLAGGSLLLLALLQIMLVNESVGSWLVSAGMELEQPGLIVLIVHGLLCVVLSLVQKKHASPEVVRAGPALAPYQLLAACGLVTSAIAFPWALVVTDGTFVTHGLEVLAISFTWLLGSLALSDSRLAGGFQLGTVVATILATIGWSDQNGWWTPGNLLTMEHLRAHLFTLSLLGLAWTLVRTSWHRQPLLKKWIPSPWPGYYRAAHLLASLALLVVLALMTLAAVLYETAPSFYDNPQAWSLSILGHSLGLVDWGCWLLLAAAWGLEQKLLRNRQSLVGLLATLAAFPMLSALALRGDFLVGHAIRWVPAMLAFALAAWLAWDRFRPDRQTPLSPGDSGGSRSARQCQLLAWSAGVPVVLFTAWAAIFQLAGVEPLPVAESSIFFQLLPDVLYAGPLAVFSVVLVLLALCTARSSYMVGAAICWQLGIFPSWRGLVAVFHSATDLQHVEAMLSATTLNFLGAFLFVLLWRTVNFGRQRLDGMDPEGSMVQDDPRQVSQLAYSVFSAVLFASLGVVAILVDPASTLYQAISLELSASISLVAVAAMLLSGFYQPARGTPYRQRDMVLLSLMVAGSWLANQAWLVDGQVSRMVTTLGCSWLVVSAVVTTWWGFSFARTVREQGGHGSLVAWERADRLSTGMLSWWLASWLLAAAVLLIGYEELGLPFYLAVRLSIGLAVVACLAHLVIQRSPMEYLALVALLWGVKVLVGDIHGVSGSQWLHWQVLTLALVSLCIVPGVRVARHFKSWLRPDYSALMVTISCWVVTAVAFVAVLASFDRIPSIPEESIHLLYTAIVLTLVTQLARSLAPRRGDAPAGFFFTGFALLWIFFSRQGWTSEMATGILLATSSLYLAISSWWLCQSDLAAGIGQRMSDLSIEDRRRETSWWLLPVSLVMTVVFYVIAMQLLLTSVEAWPRWLVGIVPLGTGAAILASADRRNPVQARVVALSSGVIALVFLCWAGIDPGVEGAWTNRIARGFLVLSTVCFLQIAFGSRLAARGGSWSEAFKWQLVINRGSALVAFCAVFLAEWRYFDPQTGTGIATPEMLLVALALVFLMLALLAGALKPERDPFSLSDKGREVYVYLAELVGLFIFVHFYLSRPWLFKGWMTDYWPFVVMLMAFGGALLGEMCERRRIMVLVDPLQHTAFLLPLIPLVGIWVFGQGFDSEILLACYGLLNIVLLQFRRNFLYALGAGFCGNLAFWFLLSRYESLAFIEHPQFWLVPPAISVLGAAQLNRDRLDPKQLTFIRYFAIVVIYLSSTSEMMIQGLGQTLWPPMVLAVLSIAGALVGIAARVRAFLYLGVAFLVISILGMVFHAHQAVENIWPWFVFMLVTGIGIWVLIALRDRYQDRLTEIIDNLRTWDD